MKPESLPGRERMYRDLAWLWPVISPPEDYQVEAEQFTDLIRRYLESGDGEANGLTNWLTPPLLLHLGCGGGHLDYTLKKHFQVVGVDLSPDMLTLARKLNPEVSYRQGDMRTLRLDQLFDTVLIADSIDYMLDEVDLQAAFQTAWEHLRPGGVFITYAEETMERFEKNRTKSSTHQRGDLEVTLVENQNDPNQNDTTYEMTFLYLIRRSGELTIEVDQHKGGIFSAATWLRLLEQAGFNAVQIEQEWSDLIFFLGLKTKSGRRC